MSDKNKSVLQQANAAVAAGNYEGFLSFCTDDTHWTFVGDRTLQGKEAVRQWMKTTYREPPQNVVTRLIAEGDFLVAMGEIVVKAEDGNDVRSAYCDVWRLREGKLAELRAFVTETDLE